VSIRRLLEKIADFHSAPLAIPKGWLVKKERKKQATENT
jgi:predicted acyltransferase (DUF342 family)